MPPSKPFSENEADLAFPTLDANELAAVIACGRSHRVTAGEVIFRTGDDPVDCCVVINGRLGIYDRTGPVEREVAIHRAGGFSGDIGLLAGRPALADARALEDGEIVRLSGEELRHLLVVCPAIGEKWVPALIRRRALLLARGHEGLHVFGRSDDPATLRACEFLYRNGVPHRWRDVALDDARTDLAKLGPPESLSLPVVALASAKVVTSSRLEDLARVTGVYRALPAGRFDVVIVGAGPAGLGAAVYAASEGLRTLVVDLLGPGGQAGTSSRIENYAGFPEGISGRDLALRSYLQALKFGAHFAVPRSVSSVRPGVEGEQIVALTDGSMIATKAVIVATGVSYRNLGVPRLAEFAGRGVYYAATQMEARLCSDRPVHVIGAGNSAGQAAMYLSRFTDCVNLVVRGDNLYASMSDYLADRIVANPRVKLRLRCEIRSVEGDGALSSVNLEDKSVGLRADESSGGVFVFIGAAPATSFLGPEVARDANGFLLTGASLPPNSWPLTDRVPQPLETSLPRVLAAGDCRFASTKRVAFAVGDGALAVTCLHEIFGT